MRRMPRLLAAAASCALLHAAPLAARANDPCGSPYQSPGTPINALVSAADDGLAATNLQQVEAGLAQQVEQGRYDVDWYLRCQLERAEAKAKENQRGMWGASAPKP